MATTSFARWAGGALLWLFLPLELLGAIRPMAWGEVLSGPSPRP